MSLLKSVPKPISSKKRTKVTGHLSGPTDQLTAIYNALIQSSDTVDVHYQPATWGTSEENTWALTVEMRPVKRRAERQERPYEDLRGVVYLVEGVETKRRKIGGTDDIRRRLGELKRDFAEEFRLIHLIHAENWKTREQDIHDYLKSKGLHVEREFFEVNEFWERWFISQPNEY